MIKKVIWGVCVILAVTACASNQNPITKPQVVATTTMIGDIARHIAGDKVEVVTLMKPGVDPHEYEPVPADMQALTEAKLLFVNGAGLERWLTKAVGSVNAQLKVVTVSDGLTLRTLNEEGITVDDPHLWFDVKNVIHYAEQIRDGLISIDPANAETYRIAATSYIGQLTDLDSWIVQQVGTLPAEKRLLVTNHDTFGYFAARYGFQIVGTIFPSSGAEASPSAQQVAELIDNLKHAGVKAVFTENTLNPDLANTIAQEAGVKVITELYTDSLGPADSPASSYIDLMRFDVTTIVSALK